MRIFQQCRMLPLLILHHLFPPPPIRFPCQSPLLDSVGAIWKPTIIFLHLGLHIPNSLFYYYYFLGSLFEPLSTMLHQLAKNRLINIITYFCKNRISEKFNHIMLSVLFFYFLHFKINKIQHWKTKYLIAWSQQPCISLRMYKRAFSSKLLFFPHFAGAHATIKVPKLRSM